MTTPVSRVISPDITLTLPNNKTITGVLEHFPASRTLVITDPEALSPFVITVNAANAPDEHVKLDEDQIIVRNWTNARGVAEALVEQGVIELTGEETRVGDFRLEALIARVL